MSGKVKMLDQRPRVSMRVPDSFVDILIDVNSHPIHILLLDDG